MTNCDLTVDIYVFSPVSNGVNVLLIYNIHIRNKNLLNSFERNEICSLVSGMIFWYIYIYIFLIAEFCCVIFDTTVKILRVFDYMCSLLLKNYSRVGLPFKHLDLTLYTSKNFLLEYIFIERKVVEITKSIRNHTSPGRFP